MKQLLIICAMLIAVNISYAQTNTLPSSGNIGIGTTAPSSKLQIVVKPDSAVSAIEIGDASPGNLNVPRFCIKRRMDANLGIGHI